VGSIVTANDKRTGDRHTGPRQRSVRGIEDELWQAAQTKAREQGTTVSAVIADLLARWVRT